MKGPFFIERNVNSRDTPKNNLTCFSFRTAGLFQEKGSTVQSLIYSIPLVDVDTGRALKYTLTKHSNGVNFGCFAILIFARSRDSNPFTSANLWGKAM